MIYKNIYFKKSIISSILNIHKIFISRVGLKNIYYPFVFDNFNGKLQRLIGLWNIGISVLAGKRGVHMSRFLSVLDNVLIKSLNIINFFKIHKHFLKKLHSNDISVQLSFIYFLRKLTPITIKNSLLNYKITLFFEKINIFQNFILKIIIPLNSLCPCSKYISYFNAHNQRCYVTFFLFLKKNVIDLNKLINLLELQSSSSLWSLLKRRDEKYFTEFSYKNPKFIEDFSRNIFFEFKKKKFFLKIENLESIHNHDVYSYLKNY
ncbi:GTP cyclohydrolase FolE2 [Candidatus Nasuia deltocephalinicola]|uniref:GTP cyclohydrolase I n=1 Tax=Candidatus Nasuia deltocephalincola TaxID=1160784 RepID=A0A974WLL2_9PROT|nr:hypothetical protein CU086_00045 [Candidatus Nasuia deltocephalinicola]BEH03903.1 GTP cyclohydrolase FolE2 [Candidatus Nasuia deltocephalinicola]